ncbi:MAG: hypothetical protein AB8F94_18400 [Saprospiraceae bacterium]
MRINLNLLCLLVILFFQKHNLAAQFGMETGAIVTIEGDTLLGGIKSASPRQSSHSIIFENKEKNKTTYLPHEIQCFFFDDGEIYESYHVKFSTKKKQYDELRFIRLIEEGKINLYILDYRNAAPLFIKKNDGNITLLCVSEDEEIGYLNVLKKEMSDCEKLADLSIKNLRRKNVQYFIKIYNDCFTGIKNGFSDSYNPAQIWAWGFGGFPFQYLNQGYEGNEFGGFIGMDLPYFKRQLSCEVGFHLYKGSNKNGRSKDIADATIRVNYNFYHRKFLSPYISTGLSTLRGSSLKPHLGGGFTVNMGRHLVKTEVTMPYFPNIKVGYGFVFKK